MFHIDKTDQPKRQESNFKTSKFFVKKKSYWRVYLFES